MDAAFAPEAAREDATAAKRDPAPAAATPAPGFGWAQTPIGGAVPASAVAALQHAGGNAATAAWLARLRTPTGAPVLHRQPTPAPAPAAQPPGPAPPPAPGGPIAQAPGPSISEGPIGDVIVPIEDWQIYQGLIDKRVNKPLLEKTTFLTIPI